MEYAFRKDDDEVVYIDDVPSGLACNCYCKACNDQLIAKKGKIKQHHFAHKTNECEYGRETTLHAMAKKLIEENGKMYIPPSKIMCHDLEKEVERFETIFPADEITLESHETRGLIPDICIKRNGKTLFVEIYVTHKVDDIKREKIKEQGFSCIEVDLSRLKDQSIDPETLNFVLISSEMIYWVHDDWAYRVNRFLNDPSKRMISVLKKETKLIVSKRKKRPIKPNERWRYLKGVVEPEYCMLTGKISGYVNYSEYCHDCKYCVKKDSEEIYCISRIGEINYKNLNKKLKIK